MEEIVRLILFSSISVVYLFFISKLLGKKQIAQLEFIDYAIGISIGSISAEMATDINDKPFYYYLIGVTIFFLFDLLVTYLGRKGKFLKTFFKGRPIIIIYEGKIDYKNLCKSKLDVNDLLTLCRDKDCFDIENIAFAVFEATGKLSILPKSPQTPTVVQDLNIKKLKSSLPNYLITDGKILKDNLQQIGKDKDWLLDKLKINKKDIKNILLATYDDKKNKITIQTKDS